VNRLYIYNILVIDDEKQIKDTCAIYKKYLKSKFDLEVKFDVINSEAEYNESVPYDVLLVDYDLKKGFSLNDKLMGDEFIKKFRENNKISKVIFYSSAFKYRPNEPNYDFPFEKREAFDLINNLQIDRIADKNNFEMMLEVIKSCCERVDVLPILLSKIVEEYEKEEIKVSYTNIQGQEVLLSELLIDIINDNEQGKAFRKNIIDTVLSVILNFKY